MANPFKRKKEKAPEPPPAPPRRVGVSLSLTPGGIVKATLAAKPDHSCDPEEFTGTIRPGGCDVVARSSNPYASGVYFSITTVADADRMSEFFSTIAKVMRGTCGIEP